MKCHWAERRLGVLLVSLLLSTAPPAASETLRVRAATLWTGTGDVLQNALVEIEDGRVAGVRAGGPADAFDLEAAFATPGFIDVHTSAGLAGLRNVAAVNDSDETSGPDQASLRALDAFDPSDPLLRYLLEHGVTIVQAGPGPANVIAGQAGIFRTHGSSADAMALRFPSALVFNLGESAKSTYGDEGEAPVTRMGTAALIRHRLAEASERRGKGFLRRGSEERDPGLEVLAQVARGELPAIFRARRADDLLTAVRIVREFGLRAALAGATEAYLVRDALAEAELPIYAGPVMERVSTPESENASYESPALLAEAGLRFALRSGFEAYVPRNRVLLFEAAVAAANGLGPERALRAITLDAAALLGLDDDYGSVERGKVGDLVLFDGDPFETTSRVLAVVVEGQVVHRGASLR